MKTPRYTFCASCDVQLGPNADITAYGEYIYCSVQCVQRGRTRGLALDLVDLIEGINPREISKEEARENLGSLRGTIVDLQSAIEELLTRDWPELEAKQNRRKQRSQPGPKAKGPTELGTLLRVIPGGLADKDGTDGTDGTDDG